MHAREAFLRPGVGAEGKPVVRGWPFPGPMDGQIRTRALLLLLSSSFSNCGNKGTRACTVVIARPAGPHRRTRLDPGGARGLNRTFRVRDRHYDERRLRRERVGYLAVRVVRLCHRLLSSLGRLNGEHRRRRRWQSSRLLSRVRPPSHLV